MLTKWMDTAPSLSIKTLDGSESSIPQTQNISSSTDAGIGSARLPHLPWWWKRWWRRHCSRQLRRGAIRRFEFLLQSTLAEPSPNTSHSLVQLIDRYLPSLEFCVLSAQFLPCSSEYAGDVANEDFALLHQARILHEGHRS